jgi:hypothetical protein
MMTWTLWRALQRPPRANRVFQMTLAEPRQTRRMLSNHALIAGVLLLTLIAVLSREFSSFLSLLILVIIPLTTLNFLLTGPIYGLRWAVQSAAAIARLRRSGLYELLCVAPPGPLNTNWLVCASVFHRLSDGVPLESQSLWPIRLLLSLPIIVYVSLQSGVTDRPVTLGVVMGLYLLLIILWFRIEDVQSMLLGGVLGMFVPAHTQDQVEVNIATIGGYLLIQLLAYLGAILLLYGVLPPLYSRLGFNGWLADYSRPALALFLLASTREVILRLLWQRLCSRLNIRAEVSLMTGYRVY